MHLLTLIDFGTLLAFHIIILPLSVLTGNFCNITILWLYIIFILFKLSLRLTLRVIIECMQIIGTHLLLDIAWYVTILILGIASMRHSHILKHLVLCNWYVTSHGSRSVLIYWHHLCCARTLVTHYLFWNLMMLILALLRLLLLVLIVLRCSKLS